VNLYRQNRRPGRIRPSRLDRLLRPIHHWVWDDPRRRARKLLSFAETEADGGRDLCRAAELTRDGLLRRLYLRHASDEHRHAELFRERGRALIRSLPRAAETSFEANWFAPGERGLDDLRVDGENDASLLAFLHLSEKAAAGRFALYQEVLAADPETQAVFSTILRDEIFHMTYTHQQLTRVAPRKWNTRLWKARMSRLWKAYLRLAAAVAGLLGTLMLLLQYALFLPPFAWLAKRKARREPQGWFAARSGTPLRSQY
jgi:rubrerythrin